MADSGNRDDPPADERQTRLASALRENLHRRKAQARARGDAPVDDDRSRCAGDGETAGDDGDEQGQGSAPAAS